MKAVGYGEGYQYAHDHPDATTSLECLPERLRDRVFYRPTGRGKERVLAARLAEWRARRLALRKREP